MLQKKIEKTKGQITIFLALVFFVLFSVFGMTISVAMFIHDKINLQNATDLASYYVASKQAEMLSAIAHSNYQIRQSWKLLAFRYRNFANGSRVATSGPLGNVRHPALFQIGVDTFIGNHTQRYEPAYGRPSATPLQPPRICIGASHLFSDMDIDNPCRDINFSIDYLSNVKPIIPIGAVGTVNDNIDEANLQIRDLCQGTTYANWWFANSIIGAHRYEQRDRRAFIEAMATNLAQPIAPGGMKDLDGRDVYEGAKKTFEYNLSESNRENFEGLNIQFQNSLDQITPDVWLKPIYVNLIVPYSVLNDTATGCSEQLAAHYDNSGVLPTLSNPAINAIKQELDSDDLVLEAGSPTKASDSLYNITVGVEKNPWYMIYNKAVAVAESRPLFLSSIFGTGIRMQAVAYAKPFGGRIGPWYEKHWPSGSETSSGGGRTDPLLPPRVEEARVGDDFDVADPSLWPNYGRFPGDTYGLTTMGAMTAHGRIIGWDISPAAIVETKLSYYKRITYSYHGASFNDPLAQNTDRPSDGPWDAFNRRLELSAIAPDAFDVTYYTISANFYDYYIKGKLDQEWFTALLPGKVERAKGDIGARGPEAPPEIQSFDIMDQMDMDRISQDRDSVPRPRLSPWLKVEDGNNYPFLTSWIPGEGFMNYGAANEDPKERFARCLSGGAVPEGRPEQASGCLKGGRSGYSVKLISKKYLEATHPIGGEGISGNILNVY